MAIAVWQFNNVVERKREPGPCGCRQGLELAIGCVMSCLGVLAMGTSTHVIGHETAQVGPMETTLYKLLHLVTA